jgi:hypothetical protein
MDLSEIFEAGKGLGRCTVNSWRSPGSKLIGLQHYKDNIYIILPLIFPEQR